MKIKATILAISLCTATLTIPVAEQRGRASRAYHYTHDKLSNHKGKVGLAAGVLGTTILTKAFSEEINKYVKPFFTDVCKKVGDWFKRVFSRNK